ncbi:hypothetical protein GA0070616_0309 [Micromonospora nigra]|uniref:Uncharacterized protein n=1 Tax=Micromonospora nigra TaxID=145857 RepID=A0A1C6RAK3_9ACTN|nr:DUF5988 family protein [Micromonospora nigra]SCL14029.1 hypothetical protein GA0070616_0309 [Micromonospora nigra]
MTLSSDSAPTVPTADPVVDGDDRTNRTGRAPTIDTEAAGIVEAVLEGGPANLPVDLRSHLVTPTSDKIKVHHYGGYEHFERDATTGDVTPVVFRWTGRTRIAE